jgi:6-phosphogluconolactonase
MTLKSNLCAAIAALTIGVLMQTANAQDYFVYVGTYTGGRSAGIYVFRFNAESGDLTGAMLAAETENPSYVAIHPNGKWLYAVNEIGNFGGQSAGAVSSFQINRETGGLSPLNQVSSRGAAPCHLIVDGTGKFVLVANYNGGSVCVLPIHDDGSVGEAVSFIQHEGSSVNPQRQQGPHAHSIILDATNRFAVVADLGLDKVFVYRFDAGTGRLTPNDPPSVSVAPGSGPRHLAFDPDGKHAYVINEIRRTITAFDWDAESGVLRTLQTISTVPEGYEEGSTAEIHVHPTGRFVYGSNRGHDSIAMYRVQDSGQRLVSLGQEPTQGSTPRDFFIDPSGAWLFAENQASDSIVLFRINQETGKLEASGNRLTVPSPVCVRMLAID